MSLVLELTLPYCGFKTLMRLRSVSQRVKAEVEGLLTRRFAHEMASFQELLLQANTSGKFSICCLCESNISGTEYHPDLKHNVCEKCYRDPLNTHHQYIPLTEAVAKYKLHRRLIPPKYIRQGANNIPWRRVGSRHQIYLLTRHAMQMSPHHSKVRQNVLSAAMRVKNVVFEKELCNRVVAEGFRTSEVLGTFAMRIYKEEIKPAFYYDGQWTQSRTLDTAAELVAHFLNRRRVDFIKFNEFNEKIIAMLIDDSKEKIGDKYVPRIKKAEIVIRVISNPFWTMVNPYSHHATNYCGRITVVDDIKEALPIAKSMLRGDDVFRQEYPALTRRLLSHHRFYERPFDFLGCDRYYYYY